MKNLFFALATAILLSSCNTKDEPVEIPVAYSSLKLQPEQDSLFLNANNESRQLALIGLIVNTTEKTITNTGMMTDARYTIRTSDTVYQSVVASKAQWISSNTAVATVTNGLVVGKSAGYAQISARIGNASTKILAVNVRAVDTAPGLSLNPPAAMLIFENSVMVSGIVQQQAVLSVTEPNSGFSNQSVVYGSDGSFGVTVTGLNQGARIITARARHATNAALYTERSKGVIYYEPNTPEANGIVGNWLGTTLGKNFNFSISHSIIPTRYDISGKMDIQFEGVGLIRDIDLLGVLNNNGTINAALSKSYQGFTVSGKFSGYFKSAGTGEGEYSAQATKTGWPKVSFNDKWTAVKLP
jgi:hypothetical protein